MARIVMDQRMADVAELIRPQNADDLRRADFMRSPIPNK